MTKWNEYYKNMHNVLQINNDLVADSYLFVTTI